MDLHQQLAAQNIGQRFQFQIAFGSLGILVAAFDLGVVVVPLAHVILRFHQRRALHREISHAGRRQLVLASVNALGIFSAGELDGARRAGKQHGVPAGSVLVLDHNRLAADHVGRPVQQQRGGDAAGQAAIDGLVLIIEGVHHHHLRRDRAGGLVHVVVERNVRVRVDDARREIFASGIDHGGAGGGVHVFAHGGNLSVLDVDAAVLNIAVGDGHHHGVLDQNFIVRWRRRLLRQGLQ